MSDHIQGEDLPTEAYVGLVRGEWPLHIFEHEAHAMAWVRSERATDKPKRLWRVRLTTEYEVKYVEPEPYLERVENDKPG